MYVLEHEGRSGGAWATSRDAIEESCSKGGMVLLYGKRKTGKTVMATDVALSLTARGKLARYTRGIALLQDLRRKNNTNDDASSVAVRPYQRWPFLVIDEVGVRIRGDDYSESDAALLTDLLDIRYQGMVATLLISNETMQDTFKILGPSIVRRIQETGFAIEANWPQF